MLTSVFLIHILCVWTQGIADLESVQIFNLYMLKTHLLDDPLSQRKQTNVLSFIAQSQKIMTLHLKK